MAFLDVDVRGADDANIDLNIVRAPKAVERPSADARSLACSCGVISAISSRKQSAPIGQLELPLFEPDAPVNAPRS